VDIIYTENDGSRQKGTFYRSEAACQQAIKPINDRLDTTQPKNLDKYR
jgi:hypothetical protein